MIMKMLNKHTRMLLLFADWLKVSKEVKRYINEGTEQFSVSLGGFDVKYDGTKNGGQGEGQETH